VSARSPAGPLRLHCTVAYATRERQYLFDLELPAPASIADALAAARSRADPGAEIPWEAAAVGVFGEPRTRSDACADGDRIELYRPLRKNPRERRRERVARERGRTKR
jgi:putative ubiquitin-RnfH superfamily antitoxin RatB of RatAB toxin-antitoxin module